MAMKSGQPPRMAHSPPFTSDVDREDDTQGRTSKRVKSEQEGSFWKADTRFS